MCSNVQNKISHWGHSYDGNNYRGVCARIEYGITKEVLYLIVVTCTHQEPLFGVGSYGIKTVVWRSAKVRNKESVTLFQPVFISVFAVDPVLLGVCDCNTLKIIRLESYEGNHFHTTSSSLFNKVCYYVILVRYQIPLQLQGLVLQRVNFELLLPGWTLKFCYKMQ